MPSKIAVAAVAMLFGLAASPAGADDENFLEMVLMKYRPSNTDLYGINIDAAKVGATTCELETPNGTSPCPGPDAILFWDLDWDDLQALIGTPGDDWTLTWDKGLLTQTIALIDFGTVQQSDWLSLPTITNPPDGAPGVPLDTSIDWEWPEDPELGEYVEAALFTGDLEDLISGPLEEECNSGELSHPPNPITWEDPSCLAPGTWTALVLNPSDDLKLVPDGLTISGDPWVLENSDWLAADSLGLSEFTVAPSCDEGTDSDGDGIADHCECGDISGDGFVNTIDARLIQRCAVGEDLPGICENPLCDTTGEGACNTIDARLVQRFAVGELTKADLHCSARNGDGLASLSAAACGHGFEAAFVVPPLVLIGGRMRRRRR